MPPYFSNIKFKTLSGQQGKPYMQVSGGEKVARLFGISWRINEPEYSTEEGGHFSYTYMGTFSIGGHYVLGRKIMGA